MKHLCSGHRTHNNSKHGMHCSIIQNLVAAENGDTTFIDWHGTFQKQMSDAKNFMKIAMKKYQQMEEISIPNKNFLKDLSLLIDKANSISDLLAIIRQSNELTFRVKG